MKIPDCFGPISRAVVAYLAGAVLAAGCASTHSSDPLEGFNRGVFAFNEAADKAVIKPLAQGYDVAVPLPGRVVVANFFSNLFDPWIAVNNLLQGKPKEALTDLARFLVNSSAGILGTVDVATEMGLEKHNEDSGQTLGRWGVGEGAYVVLPIIGPRTLRDGVGFYIDGYADPVWYLSNVAARNSLVGLRFVDTRAQWLPADKAIGEAALDKYAYVRNAYLQRRRSLVFDGKPPRETDEDARLETDSSHSSAPDTASAPGPVAVSPRSEATLPPAGASEEINESAPSRVDAFRSETESADAKASAPTVEGETAEVKADAGDVKADTTGVETDSASVNDSAAAAGESVQAVH